MIDQRLEEVISKVEQSEIPVVIMGIGLPGEDKRKVMQDIARETGATFLDLDDIYHNLERRHDFRSFSQRIFENEVEVNVEYALDNNDRLVIDNSNCYRYEREKNINTYRSIAALTIGGVWVQTPLETVIAHDAFRREKIGAHALTVMHTALTKQGMSPALEDGFDWLEIIDAGNTEDNTATTAGG